jgi:enoyl-CoA hydratase/carnithine racemase
MSPLGEEEDQITLSTRGKIAIITLNRPEKLNALNFKLYYRLACLMREVAERNDIFVTDGIFPRGNSPFLFVNN